MSPIENWVFVLGPIFHLYRGIFAPGTNEDICTGWSHRPVQMSHQARRVSSPPDTNASHLYWVVALSG
jgi:hypothetical protein